MEEKMAETFIKMQVKDSVDRPSTMRFRVTDAAAPAGYLTYVNGVAAALFGAGLPSLGGVRKAFIEIDLGLTPIDSAGDCRIQDNWQTSWTPSAEEDFRLSIPALNPDPALIVPGSFILGDVSVSPWDAVLAAMVTTAIKLESSSDGDAATGIAQAIANVRGRKRPRVGGSR